MKFGLSFDSGKSLAIIKGGTYNGEIIHVNDLDDCNKKEKKEVALNEAEALIRGFFRNSKNKLNFAKIDKLQQALTNKIRPIELDLSRLYDEAIALLDGSRGREIILDDDAEMVPIFDTKEDRQIFYVSGMSGSGKSHYAGELCKVYKKTYPGRSIFLFSNKPTDKSLDVHDPLRVPLDDSLLEREITLEDLRDSLVIFDDIEAFRDKKIEKEVNRILDLILQIGRSYHVSCIYITHLMNNYKATRIILSECHAMTIFPAFTNVYSLKYLLQKYFGLEPEKIKRLIDLQSRWVTLYKAPITILYKKGAYLI